MNSNLTSSTDYSGTATYTWDNRNRLTGITAPGLTASFVYDALGRRSSKTINGGATSFLYDGLNPVQELSGTTPVANLMTGLGIDEYFMRTDGAGSSALLTDALGSTVALADATGTVQTQYTYEPFGGTSVSGAASPNSFKYTGREDDSTGLYFYRARYYSPRLQRFVSEDPLGFVGGDPNLYAYVLGQPTRFDDPFGLEAQLFEVFSPSTGSITVDAGQGPFFLVPNSVPISGNPIPADQLALGTAEIALGSALAATGLLSVWAANEVYGAYLAAASADMLVHAGGATALLLIDAGAKFFFGGMLAMQGIDTLSLGNAGTGGGGGITGPGGGGPGGGGFPGAGGALGKRK